MKLEVIDKNELFQLAPQPVQIRHLDLELTPPADHCRQWVQGQRERFATMGRGRWMIHIERN